MTSALVSSSVLPDNDVIVCPDDEDLLLFFYPVKFRSSLFGKIPEYKRNFVSVTQLKEYVTKYCQVCSGKTSYTFEFCWGNNGIFSRLFWKDLESCINRKLGCVIEMYVFDVLFYFLNDILECK